MNETDVVALTRDLPQFGLRQGDIGTILGVEENGFVVEFLDNNDGTIALLTLDDVDIRPASRQESSTRARPEPLAPGAHLPIADVRSKRSGAAQTRLSHIDDAGQARMVDVTAKDETLRVAVAEGRIVMQPGTLRLLVAGEIAKGNVLTTAQIAGIMAAKRTHELIPMCHPLLLSGIDVQLEPDEAANAVQITATVRTTGKTGVEMEALTAVSIAGLTVYDMCKAVDRAMRLEAVHLVSKSGGASGDYRSQ